MSHCFLIVKTDWIFILERRKERREISMWERDIDWLPFVHAQTRDWTRTLIVCPDWNRTHTLLICEMANQLSHTSQGNWVYLKNISIIIISGRFFREIWYLLLELLNQTWSAICEDFKLFQSLWNICYLEKGYKQFQKIIFKFLFSQCVWVNFLACLCKYQKQINNHCRVFFNP